jgi:hypothetical protein
LDVDRLLEGVLPNVDCNLILEVILLIGSQFMPVDYVTDDETFRYSWNLVKLDEVAQKRVPKQVVVIFVYNGNFSYKN